MIVFFDFDFERTFVKTGNSETRQGRSLGKAAAGSLGSKSHSDRREPKRSCCWLTEKSEKRGPWRQVWGLARDGLQLPIAPLVASLIGTVSLQDARLRGKRGVGVLLKGKAPAMIVLKTLICYFPYIQLKFPPVLHIFLSGDILCYLVYPK